MTTSRTSRKSGPTPKLKPSGKPSLSNGHTEEHASPDPEWKEELAELNPDAMFADDFDEAFVGWIENRWAEKNRLPIAVYSYTKCIEILMREGMTDAEATEFFEFNVSGAYVGINTPLFLVDCFIRDDREDDYGLHSPCGSSGDDPAEKAG